MDRSIKKSKQDFQKVKKMNKNVEFRKHNNVFFDIFFARNGRDLYILYPIIHIPFSAVFGLFSAVFRAFFSRFRSVLDGFRTVLNGL